MIGSRATVLFKNITRTSVNRDLQKRLSHAEWQYRALPNPPKWAQRHGTAVAVLTWWWFYWHLWHGWPHLLGLHDGKFLQDPRTYTDEELGIPPDDA